MRKALGTLAAGVMFGATAMVIPSHADAFCGFYVSGADAKLFNNATQVVLMREGTRTVLSMSNNYQGPPKDFAMVVPVPVVLQKENVKTLTKDIFTHIDQLSAPRLVEYWEQDPCEHTKWKNRPPMAPMARAGAAAPAEAKKAADLGVTVEAKFAVGEYEIVILSAKDSTGLDTWIRQEGYKIPDGAEAYLRPYVQAGSKFFVAKVDTKKVTFDAQGMAQLSPLRFHYDAETFSLPIRLGLMNSNGTQDLIVNVLAKGQRYEVSNYPNVTIPTNFDVADTAKTQFGSFYAALFDRTLEKVPKGIVTEYSWDAQSCDPCPSPPLTPSELSSLGVDVLPSTLAEAHPESPPTGRNLGGAPVARPRPAWGAGGFTLTRLHARYGKDSLGEDLVFRAASPIVGGREMQSANGKIEHGATASSTNNFQGRYIIRHPWAGAITCKDPQRGIWGGPPGGGEPRPTPAQNTAFAPRGKLQLATFVKGGALPDVVALPGAVTPLGSPVVPVPASTSTSTSPSGDNGFGTGSGMPSDAGPTAPSDAGPSVPSTPPPPKSGCGCDLASTSPASASALAAAGAFVLAALRRRRRN
jgi:MYXO-CTERM domain-containing protein